MIDINQWRAAIGAFSGGITNKQVKSICDSINDEGSTKSKPTLPYHFPPIWLVLLYFGLNVFSIFFKSVLYLVAM